MVDTARLQRALGHQFGDPDLLGLALTHSSADGRNNERLEFLGDSILNHIVAEALFRKFPLSREGEMTRMRAFLVKGDTLAEVAMELQLGDYLRLGPGARKGASHRSVSVLADTLEAVTGAILLDSDVETCRHCVLGWFDSRIQQLSGGKLERDAKTRLQEYLQGRNSPLPEYAVIDVQGADHEQHFRVACRLRKPDLVVQGEGSSRRKAEQSAATFALERLFADGN